LRAALKLMLECGVHRLWVVPEAEGAPALLGWCRCSDIIRVMRVLPVTNTASEEEDVTGPMLDNFMWVEWSA